LTAHRTDPTSAGCHKLIDPMGPLWENSIQRRYRSLENGIKIDAAGESTERCLPTRGPWPRRSRSRATASCLVSRLYSYAAGRVAAKGESEWIKYLERGFGGRRISHSRTDAPGSRRVGFLSRSPPSTKAAEMMPWSDSIVGGSFAA